MVIQFNSDEKVVLMNALMCSKEILLRCAFGELRQKYIDEADCCDVLYERIMNAYPIEKLEEICSDPLPNIDKEVSLRDLVVSWDEYSERDKVGWFCGLPVQYNPFLSDKEKQRGGIFEIEAQSDK